jgi:hypothetical protein
LDERVRLPETLTDRVERCPSATGVGIVAFVAGDSVALVGRQDSEQELKRRSDSGEERWRATLTWY